MIHLPARGIAPRAGQDAAPGFPRLLKGRRRTLMAALVCAGLLLAVLAAAIAFLMVHLLGGEARDLAATLAGLASALAGMGILRVAERVLAEKLGQHYVQEIRKGLVEHCLSANDRTSLGVTIARATNDLSGVRNWIVLGLAPVTVAVPAILGTAVAIWFLSPSLAVAAVTPLLLLGAALALLAGPALAGAREVRRRRGRLAAQISDAVAAAPSIHAAGGTRREVARIAVLGDRMAAAAVKLAVVVGCLRASAAVAAVAGVVAVAGTGAWLGIDNATIAAALTAAGMMSAPVAETGRMVEYRQKYVAARRILAPILGGPRSSVKSAQATPAEPGVSTAPIRIYDVTLPGVPPVPDLQALPGQRVVIRAKDPDISTALCRSLLGLGSEASAAVLLGECDLLAVQPNKRRALVGYAAGGAVLEPGSIARAVRYRRPDLPETVAAASLAGVGLLGRVQGLPGGESTRLRAGGEPLTRAERARLQLARAVLGNPPLLILDHLDRDLGNEGCRVARELLASYPGVVLIASENPLALVSEFITWDVDMP